MVAQWWRSGGAVVAQWWRSGGAVVAQWWRSGGAVVAQWWRSGGAVVAQWWRSGESARLPPMCPGFDSHTRRHVRVEFVVGSRPCSKGFSPGSPVFLPP